MSREVLLIFFCLLGSTMGQLVLVSPNETVLSQMDENLELKCVTNATIEACRWIRMDLNEYGDPYFYQYASKEYYDCQVSQSSGKFRDFILCSILG